jgi:hypothetical protein
VTIPPRSSLLYSLAPHGARLASLAARGAAILVSIQLGACSAKSDGPATVSRPSALAIPCDANRVLENVCQQCHTSPPRNSAPFPLVTYEDTQVIASGQPIWTYMRTALQDGVMPLPPVEIDSADRDTLIRWLDAGAPARTASDQCSLPEVAPPDGGIVAESDAPDSSDGSEDGDAGSGDGCTLDALDKPDVAADAARLVDADGALPTSADPADGDADGGSLGACALDESGARCP